MADNPPTKRNNKTEWNERDLGHHGRPACKECSTGTCQARSEWPLENVRTRNATRLSQKERTQVDSNRRIGMYKRANEGKQPRC
ncbi:hypothetical protein R1flu_002176 [Riccia fluitans]|uniref:Uncharacterized protein n=1 Tax=Riccia fluitans TaxID=41844 RepID=A0ABD1Y5F2_9MARC